MTTTEKPRSVSNGALLVMGEVLLPAQQRLDAGESRFQILYRLVPRGYFSLHLPGTSLQGAHSREIDSIKIAHVDQLVLFTQLERLLEILSHRTDVNGPSGISLVAPRRYRDRANPSQDVLVVEVPEAGLCVAVGKRAGSRCVCSEGDAKALRRVRKEAISACKASGELIRRACAGISNRR